MVVIITNFSPFVVKVLGGNIEAARLLATAVHSEPDQQLCETSSELSHLILPLEGCGIWIDPIGEFHKYGKNHSQYKRYQLKCLLLFYMNKIDK